MVKESKETEVDLDVESASVTRPKREGKRPATDMMSRVKLAFYALVGAVLVVGVFSIVGKFTSLGGAIGDFFDSETTTAAGPVILHKLQAKSDLVVAEGTYEVPVVICNGKPKPYGDRAKASDLTQVCTGFRDEKATVIIRSHVESVIDLSEIGDEDISDDGATIRLRLPSPTLRRPTVDAEDGILVVGMKKSIWPGGLPDDYMARAAAAGKRSVLQVAEQSGLREMSVRSTQEIFEGLLGSFNDREVIVEIADPPKG